MQLKLRIMVGAGAGKKLAIPGAVFTIGRDDVCDLRPKSGYISRRHCELLQESTRAFVRDLNSRTGTFLNGCRLPSERAVEIQPGDQLKLGPLEFEVVFTHGLGGKKKSAVESVEEVAARTAEVAAESKDMDVNEWLMEDDEHAINGETLAAGPSPTIIPAADLIAQANSDAKAAKEAPPEVDPRQAADAALKNLLRRG